MIPPRGLAATLPVVLAPLRPEARALRRGAPGVVVQAGAGRRAVLALRGLPEDVPLVVAGVGGGLDPGLRAGDVVVATHVTGPSGRTACTAPEALVDALRDRGVRAVAGPVVTVTRPALGRARVRLAATGLLIADMESAWLASAAAPRPPAVVRVVLDRSRGSGRWQPPHPWAAWSAASTRLTELAPALLEWAAEVQGGQPASAATPSGSAVATKES